MKNFPIARWNLAMREKLIGIFICVLVSIMLKLSTIGSHRHFFVVSHFKLHSRSCSEPNGIIRV